MVDFVQREFNEMPSARVYDLDGFSYADYALSKAVPSRVRTRKYGYALDYVTTTH